MRALVLSCVLVAACSQAVPPQEPPTQERAIPASMSDAEMETLRHAAGLLGTRLKSELQAAMAAGGPVAGIAVCKEAAPALAASVSEETGFSVGRTALRVRNPGNAPDAYETETLNAFIARAAAGEPVDTLEAHAVIGGEVRYMKAIAMGEMCATCHGPALAPEVVKALAETYPEDQATGFLAGEVRGAFTLRRPAQAEPAP